MEIKLPFGIYRNSILIETTTDSPTESTPVTTATPVTTEPTTTAPPQCHMNGKCQGSTVLTYSFTKDEIDCLSQCKHYTPGPYQSVCTWITFDGDTGLCELFEECPILGDVGDCDNCVSYDVRCDTEADPLTTCYVPGNCQVQSCKLKIILF